jgi:hypothetical protein
MALESEVCKVNYKKTRGSKKKSIIPAISIFIGSLLGLMLSQVAISAYSSFTLEHFPAVDHVAICREGIIKYTPLGAYSEGQEQVKAAFAYCNSLG